MVPRDDLIVGRRRGVIHPDPESSRATEHPLGMALCPNWGMQWGGSPGTIGPGGRDRGEGPVFSSGHDLWEMVGRSEDKYAEVFLACSWVMQSSGRCPNR